jgi:hypothetical protein
LVATVLCWLVATSALAVAVPSGWAERNVIDADGYSALAQSAAHDRKLQGAMAAELAAQLGTLARNRGYRGDSGVVLGAATAYTAGPSFPGQFADANRVAHRWLFTDSARATDEGWQIDLTPMLADTSFKQTLSALNVNVPQSVTVPVTSDTAEAIRPGELKPLATWWPWVSIGSLLLTAVAALLTLAFARRRGKALAALGVSALLVGGAGWAALAIGRGYIDDALNRTTGNVRTIADVMVTHAIGDLHQWLNLTLAAGGVLVVFGVIAAVLASIRRNEPAPARPT